MAAEGHRMSGDIRLCLPARTLAGAALLAGLLSVAACAPGLVGFGSEEQEADAVAGATPPAKAAPLELPVRRAAPQEEAALYDPAPPLPHTKPGRLVTVEPGDTVIGIARRYGVAADAIIALNGLTSPYWLLAGTGLRLPEDGYRPAVLNGRRPETAIRVASLDDGPAGDGIRIAPLDEPPTAVPPAAAPAAHSPSLGTVSPAGGAGDSAVLLPPASPASPAEPAVQLASATPMPALPPPQRGAGLGDVPLPPSRNSFLWPIEGRVISGFGSKPGGMHNDGINIAVPVGSEVRAAQSGVVAYAGNELRGYGNLVLIRHGDGWMTAYAHNETLLVERGDEVRRGQVISRSGRTGRVSRPQSHFEIRRNGEPQDPLRLLTRK